MLGKPSAMPVAEVLQSKLAVCDILAAASSLLSTASVLALSVD